MSKQRELRMPWACCVHPLVLALLKNAVHMPYCVMAGIRTGVSRDLRQSLYNELMNMPMAWFSESKRGDVESIHA